MRRAGCCFCAGAVLAVLVAWSCAIWITSGTVHNVPTVPHAGAPTIRETRHWGFRKRGYYYSEDLYPLHTMHSGSISREWTMSDGRMIAYRLVAGWPMPCVTGGFLHMPDIGPAGLRSEFGTLAIPSAMRPAPDSPPRRLLIIPIWTGLVVNAALFGLAVFMVVPGGAYKCAVVLMRVRSRRCMKCGYDTRDSGATACSECGSVLRVQMSSLRKRDN